MVSCRCFVWTDFLIYSQETDTELLLPASLKQPPMASKCIVHQNVKVRKQFLRLKRVRWVPVQWNLWSIPPVGTSARCRWEASGLLHQQLPRSTCCPHRGRSPLSLPHTVWYLHTHPEWRSPGARNKHIQFGLRWFSITVQMVVKLVALCFNRSSRHTENLSSGWEPVAKQILRLSSQSTV